MALSTEQLRVAWGPPCSGTKVTVTLNGGGVVHVRAAIVDAVRALNAVLVRWGYRTRRADTGAYNCRRITGGTGYSLHAYGIALDINWSTNLYGKTLVTDMPRGMVDEILAIRTNNDQQVWGWGGDYRSVKDAMHFEIVCSPRDLATGLRGTQLPEKYEEDPDMTVLWKIKGSEEFWASSGLWRMSVSRAAWDAQRAVGGKAFEVTRDNGLFQLMVATTVWVSQDDISALRVLRAQQKG